MNLIAAKSGLLGMKGYLETQPYEMFFAVLKPFLTETAFFAPNLRGGFRVLKLKSRDLLPRNLVLTCNSLISNYCPNFM